MTSSSHDNTNSESAIFFSCNFCKLGVIWVKKKKGKKRGGGGVGRKRQSTALHVRMCFSHGTLQITGPVHYLALYMAYQACLCGSIIY